MTPQELKDLRTAAGWTQQELAKKMGLTGTNIKQRIFQYEKGTRRITPSMSKLFRLIFSLSQLSS